MNLNIMDSKIARYWRTNRPGKGGRPGEWRFWLCEQILPSVKLYFNGGSAFYARVLRVKLYDECRYVDDETRAVLARLSGDER